MNVNYAYLPYFHLMKSVLLYFHFSLPVFNIIYTVYLFFIVNYKMLAHKYSISDMSQLMHAPAGQ